MTDDEYINSEILDEHFRSPRNFGKIKDNDVEIIETNPTCGDTIVIDFKFNGDILEDVKYITRGCSVSTGAASMLSEMIIGKSRKELESISKEEVVSNIGLKLGPARERCALISYDALKKGLREHYKK
ncbi:MAG: iron-sulfur cluster assembly scaffold protein [Thermoplasmataceae archaeon]